MGFNAKELKEAGFSAKQLNNISKEYYFLGKLLHFGGFTIDELILAGFQEKDIVVSLIIDSGYNDKDLSKLIIKARALSEAKDKVKEIEKEQKSRAKSFPVERPESYYM